MAAAYWRIKRGAHVLGGPGLPVRDKRLVLSAAVLCASARVVATSCSVSWPKSPSVARPAVHHQTQVVRDDRELTDSQAEVLGYTHTNVVWQLRMLCNCSTMGFLVAQTISCF
jgi:hypothetical protein